MYIPVILYTVYTSGWSIHVQLYVHYIFKNAFYWLSVKIIISKVSIFFLSVCVGKPVPILQDGVFNMCILLIIWLHIMCVFCMFINYCYSKNNCANCTFLSTSIYNSLKENVKKCPPGLTPTVNICMNVLSNSMCFFQSTDKVQHCLIIWNYFLKNHSVKSSWRITIYLICLLLTQSSVFFILYWLGCGNQPI